MNQWGRLSVIRVGRVASHSTEKETAITARVDEWRHARGRDRAAAADGADDLTVRLCAGDPAALDEMAASCGPRLYRYLARLAPDAEMARDMTQECLLRAVKALWAGAHPECLLPWLFQIATNLAHDDHRSAYRQRVLLCDDLESLAGADGHDTEHTVLASLQAADRSAAVSQAMRQLPVELRQVIHLRFVEDQPVKEIAAIVGVPEGTVKSRLFRAYRLLERELAGWKPEEKGGDAHGRATG